MVLVNDREELAALYVSEFEKHIFEPFTKRQREMVILVCSGITTTKDLANMCGIGNRTVERHLTGVFQKAGIDGANHGKLAALVSDVVFKYHPAITHG